MAERADGNVIVDTEIDTEGFKAGSKRLQSAIKSLSTKVEGLGSTFQKAISGNSKALTTFNAKSAALEKTIQRIKSEMKTLSDARLPTDEYAETCNQIEKTEKTLDKLYNRQEKMDSTGVKENSREWKTLQHDIKLAEEDLERFKNGKSQMEASRTAFRLGADTTEYKQLESSLALANSRLSEMQSEADKAGYSVSLLKRIAGGCKKAFKSFGGAIKNGVSRLFSLGKASNSGGSAISKLGKKLTGVMGMLKRMAIRKLLSSMMSGLKEGMNNLAQYSSGVNANLSTLKSSLTRLKNSFATAFAPILAVVTPILEKLINYLSQAVTYVGKLFAALTGSKTFTQATVVQEDYAASLKNTEKAAKDAKKQLLGIDEINILGDNSKDDNNSSVLPSDMFEEVPIESSITGFIGQLKEAFKNGDFESIGEVIGTKINAVIQKIGNFIHWDNVGSTVAKIIQDFTDGVNSLVSNIDWEGLGDSVSQGINTIANIFYLLFTKIDWGGICSKLAMGLSSIISGINWAKFGETLGAYINIWIKGIDGAVANFNWSEAGSSLAAGIVGLIDAIDWAATGKTLSDAVKGLLNMLVKALEETDWQQLGNNTAKFIASIDWGGIVSALFAGLGAALGGIAGWLWGIIEAAWSNVVNWWNETAYEDGQFTIWGLLSGIWEGIKNIGTWIYDHIFKPFVDAFKNAFGIHSPSTVMAEMGGHIVNGLLNGITDTWNTTKEKVKTWGRNICEKLSNGIESAKTTVTTAAETARGWISSTWSTIKDKAITWGKDICENMANGIGSAEKTVRVAVNNVASGIKGFLGFSEPEEGPLSNFHTYMPDMIDLMTSGIKKNQGKAINAVSDMASAISEEIQSGDYNVGSVQFDRDINASLDGFSDKITDGFSDLLNRLQAIADSVTFRMPTVASKGIVPYSVSGASNSSRNRTSEDNDNLVDAIKDAVKQAMVESNGGDIIIQIMDKNDNVKNETIVTAAQRINRRSGKTIVPLGV